MDTKTVLTGTLIAAGYVGLFLLIPFLSTSLSGWRDLARRFRFAGTFPQQAWRFQSAQMRRSLGYNRALRVGADQSGLFIKTMGIFLLPFQPPLFVPWSEITAHSKPPSSLWGTRIELRLGMMEQVPFVIKESLAANLQKAAGRSWPVIQK
jgi:hypothetical protein